MIKDMGKWTIFTLVCALVFLGMNELYKRCTYYRSIEGIYRYEEIPFGLQLVNTGSSHGEFGLDYSAFQDQYNCFNFAFSSQMLSLDASILDTYQQHLSEGCVVIIPISVFSFYQELPDIFELQKSRYYRILDYNTIPCKNLTDLMQYRYFPILTAGKKITKLFKLHRTNPDHKLHDGEVQRDDNLSSSGKERALGHLALTKDGPKNIQLLAFKRILKLSKEKKWRPVIISTPLLQHYDRWVPKEFKTNNAELVQSIVSEVGSNAIYLDYTSHETFYDNTEYYWDSDHLNKKGRMLFTKILVEDLQAKGLL